MEKLCYILILLGYIACSDRLYSTAEDGYLTGAEDAQIFYKTIGAGKDTVVVVHGGPGAGMHSVLPSVNPLAERYSIIFYDQRGGGRSTLPVDTTKLKARYFVEDLEAVRKHFGIDQMNVIAHSFGSIIVAEYAQKYSDHLKRVVFHGATGSKRSEMAELFKTRAKVALSYADTSLANKASKLLQSLLKGTAADPVATCREYENVTKKLAIASGDSVSYKGTTCNAPAEAVRYYYKYTVQLGPEYFGNCDYTSRLEDLDAPLMVLYGINDSLALPIQKSWVDAVPNGQLVLVPEAKKAAFSANPGFVFSKIDSFFQCM